MTVANYEETQEKLAATHAENRSQSQYQPEEMSAGRYFATRFTTLKPPMTIPPSPLKLLRLLTRRDWLFFAVAMCGWTWGGFDFFTVSLTVPQLAAQFNKSISDITWGITLVLMLRPVGSILFGFAADRYGRKWLFITNMALFMIIELGTGFCQTYPQFLACRALFGVAFGGIYGNAVVTALEDCPSTARGIVSGILQGGYTLGFLLATIFARALVGTTSHGWRPLYWLGACPPILIIIFRLWLPETQAFLDRQAVREVDVRVTQTFLKETKIGLRNHWRLLVYMVLLLAGLEFQTHGNQDLYPTLLTNQHNFSPNAVTVTQVVASIGCITGGITFGYLSQILGRRLSIIIGCFVGGALLYPYTFISTEAVIAPAFFAQFFILGVFGVVPIHLSELSPGSIRTFAVGTTYQLGSLISCASSTIEATLGQRFPLPSNVAGVPRYDYGKVICIFTACALVYDIILVLVGPEKRGIQLDVAHDADMEEAIGHDTMDKVLHNAPHNAEDVEMNPRNQS